MTRPLLFLLALPLVACSPADIIEGKPSPFQLHQERMALVEMPVVSVETIEAVIDPVIEADPVVVEVVVPEPEPEPEPVCVPVFRVVVCP